MAERKESKAQGQIKRLIKSGAGAIFGLELTDGVSYYLSKSSKIDLSNTQPGSWADIAYGEYNGKRYINAFSAAQSPQQELAGEPLDESEFVPEREETPAQVSGTAGSSTKEQQGTAQAAPAPAPPAADIDAGKTGKIAIKDLPMEDRRALIAAMDYNDRKALIDFDRERSNDYWAGKSIFDGQVFELNKEKFVFEKQRAAEIGEQVRIKIRADMIPLAAEIYTRSRGENAPPVAMLDQLEHIFKVAHQLSMGAEKGFPAAVEDIKRMQEKMQERVQSRSAGQGQGSAGRSPG